MRFYIFIYLIKLRIFSAYFAKRQTSRSTAVSVIMSQYHGPNAAFGLEGNCWHSGCRTHSFQAAFSAGDGAVRWWPLLEQLQHCKGLFRFQTKGESEGEIAFECKCPWTEKSCEELCGVCFFNFYFFSPNGCDVIELIKKRYAELSWKACWACIYSYLFLVPDSLLEDVCGYSLEGKLEQIFGVESFAFQYKFCF